MCKEVMRINSGYQSQIPFNKHFILLDYSNETDCELVSSPNPTFNQH